MGWDTLRLVVAMEMMVAMVRMMMAIVVMMMVKVMAMVMMTVTAIVLMAAIWQASDDDGTIDGNDGVDVLRRIPLPSIKLPCLEDCEIPEFPIRCWLGKHKYGFAMPKRARWRPGHLARSTTVASEARSIQSTGLMNCCLPNKGTTPSAWLVRYY